MSKKKIKLILILQTIFFGLWVPVAFVFLPFIAFAYDDPTAGGLLLTLITILWVLFPFVLLVSLGGSWVMYRKKKMESLKRFLLLPWVHILSFILLGLFFFEW